MNKRQRFITVGAIVAIISSTLFGVASAERDGSYVASLRRGVSASEASRIAKQYGVRLTYRYDELGGFAFSGSSRAVDRLRRDRRVEGVDADQVVRIADPPPQAAADHLEVTLSNCTDPHIVVGPPPCQDGTSQFPTAAQAGYTGGGTLIAILDTGVKWDHPFFAQHQNVRGHGYGRCAGVKTARDSNGHGTRTASNSAGQVGVAHEADVLGVKVFPGSSDATTWSRVICGLNYVRKYNKNNPADDIDVVNLSLAGPGNGTLRTAVQRVINSGVVVVAAAGNNSGGPVQAPARYAHVISVSATKHSSLERARFSARGADIAAPGAHIFSAALGGGGVFQSGTSRSSPQVAGAAAILRDLGVAAADVQDVLTSNGTPRGNSEPLLNTYCAAYKAEHAIADPGCPFWPH